MSILTGELTPNGIGRINDLSARLLATEGRLDKRLADQDRVLNDITNNVSELSKDVAVIKDRLLNDEKDADRQREDRRNGWEVKAILVGSMIAALAGFITTLLHIH